MKTALITGASRGLGRALATALHRDGWTLVVDARTSTDLDTAATSWTGPVQTVPGDITDPAHRADLLTAVGDRLDLLVLNASTLGQAPLPPVASYDLGALRATLETNVVADVGLIQLALPALRRSGGRILAITSDAAVEAYEGWSGYAASKAALEAVARVLAVEEPALRVYAVDPGDLRTQMHADAFPGEDISDRPEPETAVPGLLQLVYGEEPSGRYRAADLVERVSA